MKKILALATLVAGLAVAGAASAGNGNGNGATVVNSSGCTTSPLALVCWDIRSTTNITETPSGNLSYVTNGIAEMRYEFAFAGCTYSRSNPFHLHALLKDGEGQSVRERSSTTTSFDCGGGFAQTCTSIIDTHYGDGTVQFSRPDFVCTMP